MRAGLQSVGVKDSSRAGTAACWGCYLASLLAPALLLALTLPTAASAQDDALPLGREAFAISGHEVLSRAFDNFWDYDAHPELQDHYAAMWAHVVDRFADHPAVLGYDIMNEPWEGKYVSDQETFDETLYHAFLQRVIDAIRAQDDGCSHVFRGYARDFSPRPAVCH